MSPARIAVVIGGTGRLGPAVVRALLADGWHVRAVSRRAPRPDERGDDTVEWTRAERRDVATMRHVLDGAGFVFDGLAFDAADAGTLLQALDGLAARPSHLVFASSIAEYGPRLGAPETALAAANPSDPYGAGKRAARLAYEAGFGGTVHTLLLPRLVAEADPARRDAPYLDSKRATGKALVGGDPSVIQCTAPVEGVARVVARLAETPGTLPPGPVNVGPPQPTSVASLVAALLQGAGEAPDVGRHPDPSFRGPHGRGPEPLDTSLLRRAMPDLAWPDVLATMRAHGAWLARTADASKRPARLVALSQRAYEQRRSVDVHGRRRTPFLAQPRPELERLAAWVSPAVYVDTGRPCNSACLYCAVPPHGDTHGYAPLDELGTQARLGRQAGCDRAILVGGEPTTYPRLDALLARLGEEGLHRHVVMTNGLRLAERGFLDRLAAGGVATLHVSVDTADEATYDRLSRSHGQFERQAAGLDAALRDGRFNVYVYTVVTAVNAGGLGRHLRKVAERSEAAGRPPPPVLLAFTKPVGDALAHLPSLGLAPHDRARHARDAVAAAAALGLPLGIRNLPACLAPELADRLVDYYLEDFSIDVASGERLSYAHNTEHLEPVEACRACAHRAACPGIYREDAARFGTADYRPLDAAGLAT